MEELGFVPPHDRGYTVLPPPKQHAQMNQTELETPVPQCTHTLIVLFDIDIHHDDLKEMVHAGL